MGALFVLGGFVGVGDGAPDVDPAKHLAALSEANLREHARDFTAEARAAGVPVTLDLYGGIHDWPYFRQGLINAIRWNLFAPLPETPSSWTYVTVAQRGDVYGYKFAFQEPPTSIETLVLNGGRLTGSGSGSVTILTPSGQTLSLRMAHEG